MKKERLDVLLVEQGFAPSRERAKRLIMAGQVLVDEQRIDKAGTTVAVDAKLRVVGEDLPYVSRGGLKLAKGMEVFGAVLAGKTAADIGASTGGFTDCMLQNGAAKIYAIDVGYGQLAWSLRSAERVTALDRTNVRTLDPQAVAPAPGLVVGDLSFISLTLVLAPLLAAAAEDADLLLMVKPQFEVGRGRLARGGVVRDPEMHVETVLAVAARAHGLGAGIDAVEASPLPGPAGNVEYFVNLHAARAGAPTDLDGEALLAETRRAVAAGPAASRAERMPS